MSTPMPSPSMYGMIGSSGTRNDPSGPTVILPPLVGGVSLSYVVIELPFGGGQTNIVRHEALP